MSDGASISEAVSRRLDEAEDDVAALSEDQLGLNHGYVKLSNQVGALSKDVDFCKGALRLLAAKLSVDLSALEGH
jgi:hypothetical protein